MKNLQFNGQILPSWVVITKVPLEWAAPASWVTRKIANRQGVVAERFEKGPRVLPFEVEIMADNENDLDKKLEALAFILHTEKEAELMYSGVSDRWFMAVHDSISGFNKIINSVAEGTITFLVPSGQKLGQPRSASFTASRVETVAGTDKTYPVFTVTFSAAQTNYRIEHDNGKYMNIIYTFGAGEVLTLNHKTGDVQINGVSSPQVLSLQSKPFTLEPGSNTLTVTVGSANSQTDLSYTDTYK